MWFKPWPFHPQTLEVTKTFERVTWPHHPKKVTNSLNCQGLVVSWICSKKPNDGYRSDGWRVYLPTWKPMKFLWDHGTRSFQDSKGKATGPFSASAANAKGDHTGSSMFLNGNQMSYEKRAGPKRLFRLFYGEKTSYPVYMGIIS